jgi:hypothetical protein
MAWWLLIPATLLTALYCRAGLRGYRKRGSSRPIQQEQAEDPMRRDQVGRPECY